MTNHIITPTPDSDNGHHADDDENVFAITPATTPTTILEAALAYHDRGWQPIPVPFGRKNPGRKDWQQERRDADNLRACFEGRLRNLGVLLGEPSGNLVDVDLDCVEACVLAGRFVPTTGAVFGRAGKPDSHWLYVADPPVDRTRRYEAPGGTVLLELRGAGAQTIFPPSAHEDTGEIISWSFPFKNVQPEAVHGQLLVSSLNELAAAVLVARSWPDKGSRHQASMALAGGLLTAGWEEAEAEAFIDAVAYAAGDEERKDRRKAVRTTTARLEAGGKAMGWKQLAELLKDGERALQKVREWIPPRDTARLVISGRPYSGKGPIDGQNTIESHLNVMATNARDDHLWGEGGQLPGLVNLADVTPEKVSWLWPGRVPLAKLTILDGDPGLGKSLVTTDLAARISTGGAMPDGTYGDLEGAAGVVLLSAEDGLADTIRPRLDAAGANVHRIAALDFVKEGKDKRLPTLADLSDIRAAVEAVKAKLVVVDPVMAFLPGSVNSYRDQDTRRLLAPLADLAEETSVAIIVVRHLNKASGSNPIYRGAASIAFIGAARSGLLIGRDPDDESGQRRILAMTKSNLSAFPPALVYRIEGGPNSVAHIIWEGETKHTAAMLLGEPRDAETRDALSEAMDFLRGYLAEGRQPADEVKREARTLNISDKTLWRAKTTLGVSAEREGFGKGGVWYWSLLDQQPEPGNVPAVEEPTLHTLPPPTIRGHQNGMATYGDLTNYSHEENGDQEEEAGEGEWVF